MALLELNEVYDRLELDQLIPELLIYGAYPELLTLNGHQSRIDYLDELSSDYLYRDVLELENIRAQAKVRNLLKLLALQLGNEVSLSELGKQLSLSKHTVERYLQLLEISFVIFRLSGFSCNLRKEVNKKPKIYFYDLGVRKSIINHFNDINQRNDVSALWENFLLCERMKRNEYQRHHCNRYFWRTYTGAALDYVEEYAGELHGYKFKWQQQTKAP